MTLVRIDVPGFVYAALVDGDVVRVEFSAEPDRGCMGALFDGVRSLQLQLGGCQVKQIAIGAQSFVPGELASIDADAIAQLEAVQSESHA